MNKNVEGTKVKYNNIDTEIEAVSKSFTSGTFRYKLKNISNLLDFSEFFIKTDEIIDEIIELVDNIKADLKENVKETIKDVKDDIVEALDDIENIIKENKPKSKKSK